MIEKIISVLKECEIEEYQISEITEESAELFFVKKTLDMKRAKKVTSYKVNVYVNFEKADKKFKGMASFNLFPGMGEEEIRRSALSAKLAASFVNNPYYELAKPTENGYVEMESDLTGNSMEKNMAVMTEALFAEDNREDAFINSAELFIYDSSVRIRSSNGINAGYRKLTVKGEFVVQCRTPLDVETYKSFEYRSLDVEALKRKVRMALEYTRSRAEAVQAPRTGSYRVILSDEYMSTLFSLYTSKASAAYIYAGYSDYKLGKDIQTGEKSSTVTGDRITLTCVASEPYSSDGIRMKDRVLVEEGILRTITGDTRFAQYIGVEPTGNYTAIKVEPGTVRVEDMKKEPYLHVVNFSDFQMDSFTGHFGGEIRLAYLYDGEKVTPVTGGSINGNWYDVQSRLVLSKETQTEAGYEGPLAICMDDIPVAGSN